MSVTGSEGVVVIGGSLAGIHTADALRAEGWSGPITVVDGHLEPHFDRPPMSKEYLGGSIEADRLRLRDRAQLEATGAQWRLGTPASALDVANRRVRLADGSELGYDQLVIATGVSPILPPALAVPGAHTLRNREDADRLRPHLREDGSLIIIGAGFIGLEVAATFASSGAQVTIVEALSTPVQRQLGPTVGNALRRMHESHRVRFHLDRQASSVSQVGEHVVVTLDDGTKLTAEALLIAVGSRPGTAWLENSGLTLENGVVANGHLEVADGIYAVGDVARWPHPLVGRPVRIEHWTNAVEQARYVAKRIAGTGGDEVFAALPYFWSDQYGTRVQAHGFPSEHAEVELIDGDLDSGKFAVLFLDDGRAHAVAGMNNAKQVLVGRRRVLSDLAVQEVSS
jgi:3-phenylpropionate/trans-cinnamate dioxygenase ferredoxin reductase component